MSKNKDKEKDFKIIKGIKIFDTHGHLNDDTFLGRVKEVVEESKKYNVDLIVCPGFDLKSSKKAVEIAEENENVYAAVGIHPDECDKYEDKEIEVIDELAKHPKVVAIGEIGLDYYWHKNPESHEKQKVLFKKQIDIANKYDLPIAIHTREATLDMIEILKTYKCKNTGIMHCVPLNEHLIKETLKLGYYISFSGIITFKNAKNKDVLNLVPKDKILVETDSPYLTPEPRRGKENFPGNTYFTLLKAAEIRNDEILDFASTVYNNSKKVYKIKT